MEFNTEHEIVEALEDIVQKIEDIVQHYEAKAPEFLSCSFNGSYHLFNSQRDIQRLISIFKLRLGIE
jgi:hypothetical protein